ncbi:hypothetical protein [Sedimentibacter sp.]|uniref:hypothetical protein n=1 Tax=Sedimentibacter sp. TaxID=1960295 RepID=UPI0028AFF18E|nr:hypothetical protein [Sedimentibacter sp.]
MNSISLPKNIKLFVTIVNRGYGEKIAEMLRENEIMFNIIALGKGTAKSEILNYLGLGQTDKDIVLSVVQEDKIPIIINNLREKFNLKEPGNGIAFSIPISSVDSAAALELISSIINNDRE